MAYFQAKNTLWVRFEGPFVLFLLLLFVVKTKNWRVLQWMMLVYFMASWSYFMVIWYIFPVLERCTKKYLATLVYLGLPW
jgi:hypothetical protein